MAQRSQYVCTVLMKSPKQILGENIFERRLGELPASLGWVELFSSEVLKLLYRYDHRRAVPRPAAGRTAPAAWDRLLFS